MKTGKTLEELAIEIDRQVKTKRDFVANTAAMKIVPECASVEEGAGRVSGVQIQLGEKGLFPITEIAHNQIAEHVDIPRKYYDRMRAEAPALLANNIEEWFRRYPAPRLVRTLDGGARAFLSDKFQTFDNFDFAHAIMPVLQDRRLKVVSCELTERRLYVKAIDEQLFTDVPVGFKMGDGSHRLFDTCAPVVAFGNSEVGFGRMFCDVGVYTSACTNLAMFAKSGMKRTHVGTKHILGDMMDVEDLDAIMSTATRKKTMEAMWMQIRDVVAAAFDRDTVAKRAEQLATAAGRKITAKIDDVMEVVQERFGLDEGERESVFTHLIEGGSLTQYGLHAAVTRAAQDVASYDRASELEYAGGKVVELTRTEWAQLAEAA